MNIVIGLAFDDNKQLLITKRAYHKPLGGLWEFPGGKVEKNESLLHALAREFHEEVGIKITQAEPFKALPTITTDKLTLHIFRINAYHGAAILCEQQADLKWVAAEHLAHYEFPETNQPILKALMESSPH